MRTLFVVALATASATAWCAQAEDRCAANDARIESAISAVNDKQRNVGLQVAIWRSGRVSYSKAWGYADLERQRPATTGTRFAVASITKGFTGLTLLMAEQRRQVSLDVPVQTYVPEFPRRAGGDITLRLLAGHFSGLPQWDEATRAPLYTRNFKRLDQILPLYADLPLGADAFHGYSYSSIGYNLLALAVERASGRAFQDLVRSDIIVPLGLKATDFDDLKRRPRNLAARYSWIEPTKYYSLPAPERVPDWDYSHNMAGGDMYSTAGDLARFGGALVAPGFLSPAEWTRLYTRFSIKGVKPAAVTYGWFVNRPGAERKLNLTGSNAGVQAGVFVYPDRKLVVAILSNSWGIGSSSGELTYDLPQKLADLCVAPLSPR